MTRRHGGERIEAFRRRIHEVHGWRIRDLIASWAQDAAPRIVWPDLPSQITDRDADVWEPLIAIADAIGGGWPARARVAAVALVAASKDVEPSLGVRLLSDLKLVFADDDELGTKAVLQRLHELEEAPWSDIKGKPLDERSLAYRLRQYGVRSKTIRIGGATPKGYARTDFVDLWRRYLLPLASTSATSATSATLGGRQGVEAPARVADVADVADVALAGGDERVCAHCQRGHGQLNDASFGEGPIMLHPGCVDAYRAGVS